MAVTAATLAALVDEADENLGAVFSLATEGIMTRNANSEIDDALSGLKEILKAGYGQDGADFPLLAQGTREWYEAATRSASSFSSSADRDSLMALIYAFVSGVFEQLLDLLYDTADFFDPDPVPASVAPSALQLAVRAIGDLNTLPIANEATE